MPSDPDVTRFLEEQITELAGREPGLSFDPEEYAARLDRLRAAMGEAGIDLLLVSSPDAMCWLHGYRSRWYKAHGPTAWPPVQCTAVHVEHDRMIQFDMERHRYLIGTSSVVDDLRLASPPDLAGWMAFIMGELRAEGWLGGRAGIELWSSVPNRPTSEAFEAALVDAGCVVVDGSQVARAVRRIKSPAELEVIERASAACDAGIRALQSALRPGMTELEAWNHMTTAMTAAGGEHGAIHETIWSGSNLMIHALCSHRPFAAGDLVGCDPCGVVSRYHANTARTLSIGEPEPAAVKLMEMLAAGSELFFSLAKAGTPVRAVTSVMREYYRDAGLWDTRGWLGGYELGVAMPPDWVGEWLFSLEDEDPEGVFEENLVTNYESVSGLALIDTVVYREDGAHPFTTIPREILQADL